MAKLEWTSLRRWLAILGAVIVLRVLAGIVTNDGDHFPEPNFHADFLVGREQALALAPGNLRRFRCLRGTCMCSSFQIRCTRLMFTFQPPKASGPVSTRCVRSLPCLGNDSTIFRITAKSSRSPSIFRGR